MKSRSIGILMAVITVIVMLGHVAPASAAAGATCGRGDWVLAGGARWDRTSPLMYSSGAWHGETIQFRSYQHLTYTRPAYRDGRCTKQTARVGSAHQWRIRVCDSTATCTYSGWKPYTWAALDTCSMKVKPGILPGSSIHACDPISGQWRRIQLT